MKKKTEQLPGNRWRNYFVNLLYINFGILFLIALLIFWPVSSSEYPTTKPVDYHDSSEFVVRTTKQNLNDLVNAYINKFLEKTNHRYSVSLEEDVHLQGDLPVFSTTVPLSIHLEPIVQEDGNVILKQRSISLGLLQLPNKKIMEYMKKSLPMPDWVVVNPKEEEIYVAVTEMDIKSNFQVAIEQFDVEANHFAFRIRIPYSTLGID
ncbi:YpmS family protein [Ornithinibacillus sp. 4-3]|uniref:YpmS family protein n=1 Tax=Ornithinibacillus sp. 4-3 TaxID=3231488 RepID=A0AB39HL96_9BACI